MKGKLMLYICQCTGCHFWARTVKDLRDQVGGGKVSKMYATKKDGRDAHCGYVIGRYWLTAFIPYEVDA